ncbi:MAG: C_GCAxxG_C_C family protein [Desulfovibrio sp.]|nr:C_GCAxxG_C_C family protein [Desulfovibrio sp.]
MHPLMLELLPWVRQGYCCSQLLVLLMLQAMNRDSPDAVLAARGLCHGIGQSDGPCGLLTGGACALTLACGEDAHPSLFTPLLHDYATWFATRTNPYGGWRCGQVVQGLGAGHDTQPEPTACGALLAECWERMLELIQEYNLDLTVSP